MKTRDSMFDTMMASPGPMGINGVVECAGRHRGARLFNTLAVRLMIDHAMRHGVLSLVDAMK